MNEHLSADRGRRLACHGLKRAAVGAESRCMARFPEHRSLCLRLIEWPLAAMTGNWRSRPSRVVRGRRLADELKLVTAILEQPLIEKILTRLGLQARARPPLVEPAPRATRPRHARRRGCGCAEAPLPRPPLAAVQCLWSRRPRSLPGRAADTYGRRTRLERPAFPSSSLTS